MESDRWWQKRGEEAAQAVIGITDALQSEDGDARKNRWDQALSIYNGKGTSAQSCEDLYNVSRSAVDTAQAEIAARQRPKPMFLTSGADWRTKRKAKKLDRFVEGNLHQRQGRYADAWELGEDMFRAASIAVGSVAKVVPDVQAEKVRIEHIPAHEILIDPGEAECGDPQNWFHLYEMDLDAAIEEFCGELSEGTEAEKKERELKLEASTIRGRKGGPSGTYRVTEKVKIREAWRLPISSEKPGRHVFACDGGCLHEEEWLWPSPPLALLVWSRDLFGVWGEGLIESGAEHHRRIQEMADRLHERFTLCAQTRIYFVPGTADEAALKSNDSVILVPMTTMSEVPRTEMVPPVTPAEREMLQEEISRYFDMCGISQMSASSRKEAGVDAAVAMQTLNDIKSVRFLPKARAYELLFVRLGELIVRAARDIAVAKPSLIAKWPGKRFLEEIQWKEVDLPEDMYEVRVAPVSAMSRDPAQRLQIAEQLAASGRIPHEKYLELIGLPDLDSVLQSETAESQWVERLMDRYLDAEDDAHLKELGGYERPEGYFAKPLVVLISVQQIYFQARLDDAPRYNLALLERYMRDLESLINRAAPAPPASPGMMPGAAPPMPGGIPMPGMPPGAPPAPPMGVAA